MKLVPHVSFGGYDFGADERSLSKNWKPYHHDEFSGETSYASKDLPEVFIWVETGRIYAIKATRSVILGKHELIGSSRVELVAWFGEPEDKDLVYLLDQGDFEVWDFDSGAQVWIHPKSGLVSQVIMMKNDED